MVNFSVVDSNCEIDLSSAESLLNVLDARHVAGWYHPAMKTLLELNYEKGFQNSLKTMLKDARFLKIKYHDFGLHKMECFS